MSAHTPGPWRVGVTGHVVYEVAEPELRIAMCSDVTGHVLGRNGKPVSAKEQMDTEKANARLIAAAPDLLAACEALIHGKGVGATQRAEDLALAAIAKARGGE